MKWNKFQSIFNYNWWIWSYFYLSANDGAHYLLRIHLLLHVWWKILMTFLSMLFYRFCNFVFYYFIFWIFFWYINFQTSIRWSVDNDVDKDWFWVFIPFTMSALGNFQFSTILRHLKAFQLWRGTPRENNSFTEKVVH